MNWLGVVSLLTYVCILGVMLTLLRNMRRHKRFQEHMLCSRRHSNRAYEAFGNGDRERGEMFLAAAVEELDRASYQLGLPNAEFPRRSCPCSRPSAFAITLSNAAGEVVGRVERCEACISKPDTTGALERLGIRIDQSVVE